MRNRKMWVASALAATLAAPAATLAQSEQTGTTVKREVRVEETRVERTTERTADRAGRAAERKAEGAEGRAERAGARTDEAAERLERQTERAAERVGNRVESTGRTIGQETSDTVITTKVKAAFIGDDLLNGSDISVDTEANGDVTLSGTVPNRAARRRAVQVTRDVKGVRRVNDSLKVGGTR